MNIRSVLIAVLLAALLACPAWAENINPDKDGSRYAWSESAGWLNAEPLGEGGPGAEVADAKLSGYLWAENASWVSLSCENSGSCGTSNYGVVNDGSGNLSGYAWSENAGWINFSCETNGYCATVNYGVKIDPDTGSFSGFAWSENLGFIRFASSSPVAYLVKTSWPGELPLPPCFLRTIR